MPSAAQASRPGQLDGAEPVDLLASKSAADDGLGLVLDDGSRAGNQRARHERRAVVDCDLDEIGAVGIEHQAAVPVPGNAGAALSSCGTGPAQQQDLAQYLDPGLASRRPSACESGRTAQLLVTAANGRYRRILVVAARSGGGPFII